MHEYEFVTLVRVGRVGEEWGVVLQQRDTSDCCVVSARDLLDLRKKTPTGSREGIERGLEALRQAEKGRDDLGNYGRVSDFFMNGTTNPHRPPKPESPSPSTRCVIQ